MADIDVPRILQFMVKSQGSDIFFHTGAQISMKTANGFAQFGDPLPPGAAEKAARSVLKEEKIHHLEKHGEVDFSVSLRGIGRFRGNAFRQRGEVAMVLRQVPGNVPTIDELGVPQVLKQLVMERHGLVLLVGATASGKSTTLAAMIDHRNSNVGGHILTLEDPIEFMHRHKKSIVAQREIGTDTESFSTGMRAAMRESPDVVLLGEIRDLNSMEYALKFANTGHLALSTLHANNSISTMERIMGFYDGSEKEAQAKRVAENLRAIVCQRLAPRQGGGKVAVVEVLVNTGLVSDLISKLEISKLKDVIERGGNYGMQSFDQHLVKLYIDGVIAEETAYEFADSKSNVKIQIKLSNEKSKGSGGLADLSLTPMDETEFKR
jgi:twitching motility protein PilU